MQEVDAKALISKLLNHTPALTTLISWPAPLDKTSRLLDLAGIYLVAVTGTDPLLKSPSQVVYVGMSSNIRERWKKHHKMPVFKKLEMVLNNYPETKDFSHSHDGHLNVCPWYLPFATTAQLCEIESELIRTFNPIFNEKMSPATLRGLPALLSAEESV